MSDGELTDSSSIGVENEEEYLLPCPKITFNHDIFNTLQQYEDELKSKIDSLGRSQESSESSKIASNLNSILSFEESKLDNSKTESKDNLISTDGSIDRRFNFDDLDHKSYEYEYISYYDEEDDNEPEVVIGGEKQIPTEVKKFANYNFMNTLTSVEDNQNENEIPHESSTLPDGMGVAEGSVIKGNAKTDHITTSDILSDFSDSPVEHVELNTHGGGHKSGNSSGEEYTPEMPMLACNLVESESEPSEGGDSFNSTTTSLANEKDKRIEDEEENEKPKVTESPQNSPSKEGYSIISSSFGSPSKQDLTVISHTLEDIQEVDEADFASPKPSEVISGIIDVKSTDEESNLGLEKTQGGVFDSFLSYHNLKSVPPSMNASSNDFISEESKNNDRDEILSSFASSIASPIKEKPAGESEFNSTLSTQKNNESDFSSTISTTKDKKDETFDSDFDESSNQKSNISNNKINSSSEILSEIKSEQKSDHDSFASETKSSVKSKASNSEDDFTSEIISKHSIKLNEPSDQFISEQKSQVVSEGGSSDFISFSKSSIKKANSESDFVSFVSTQSNKKLKTNGSSDFISVKSEKNEISSSEFITEESSAKHTDSDFISMISSSKQKDDDDDFISTIKSEKESSNDFISVRSSKQSSSGTDDFISTIKSEKSSRNGSSEFISYIQSSEKPVKSESDDFISTIKSEKRTPESSEFISYVKSEKNASDDSDDFSLSIKSEKTSAASDSNDFISTIKSEKQSKVSSSEFISVLSSEKKDISSTDEFISTIKSSAKSSESEGVDFISTIKSSKKSVSESEGVDFISTIKSSTKVASESEGVDFISTIKSSVKSSESDDDDFISTIKSEKKSESESEGVDFISTIKSSTKVASESEGVDFISTIKSTEKSSESEGVDFISTIKSEKKSESDSEGVEFISTIKSTKEQYSDDTDFISTIKSEKASSGDDFISTVKTEKTSGDVEEFISEIKSQKEPSEGFSSTIKSQHESEKSNNSLPDDFISTIKSTETVEKKNSAISHSSHSSSKRKRKSSSSSRSQVVIDKRNERSVDGDEPQNIVKNESSENFIFQSPQPKQAKSRIKKDEPINNETLLQLINTISKMANHENSPKHHHRHHRHYKSDEVPCIPLAFRRTPTSSDQYSSSSEPVVNQRRTKLSISRPFDANDLLDVEEVQASSLSASDIPKTEEIPKPTFISFSRDESEQKKPQKSNLRLSRTKQIGDIPPSPSKSVRIPLGQSEQNTYTNTASKSPRRTNTQSPTIMRLSSNQFSVSGTNGYTSYGGSMVDENYISTIRSARVQLASIQNSISISRQKRAMHESRLSSFRYTKNPYNE